MTFNDADHPRGHASNPGSFSTKMQGAPEIESLTAPTIKAQIRREAWVGNGIIQVGEVEEFPISHTLDTMTLEAVRKINPGDSDHGWLYFAAEKAGTLETHDGPFTVMLDDDTLRDYIAEREARGQEDAVTGPVPLSPGNRRATVGQALISAYKAVPTRWVLAGPSRTKVQASFKEAHDSLLADLTAAGISRDELDYDDKRMIETLKGIADGPDPRGGPFKNQAAYASALLADWIIGRDEQFTLIDASNAGI